MSTEQANLLVDVSRETLAKLIALEGLVRKWSNTVNLISRSTTLDLWHRHIEDSVFIAQTAPGKTAWLDIGSGGGFPGLVVAIMSHGQRQVTLVESDVRKAEFLRTARRELSIEVEIINERIENLPARYPGVISARALAPLPQLLDICFRQAGPETSLVLPKGKSWREELLASRQNWTYDLDVANSPVMKDGVVLKISNLARKPHEA